MKLEESAPLEQQYSKAIEFLYGLRSFGAKLGLETIQFLCEKYDHPERGLHFIHVAGSNGKGSVCAILESIYRHAGYRAGLFTSPHLISFAERIQVNHTQISKEKIVGLVGKIKPVLDSFPPASHPTFFEAVTLMALLHFQEEKCEIILWETGLGGRLDSTNIVTPLASVITNISLEHQQYLGNTLTEIAYEKSGIIKEGVPVITTEANSEPLDVIKKIAKNKSAPLFSASFDSLPPLPPQFPEYQKNNISLALKTVDVLQPQLPVSISSLHEGLYTARWPGRFQIIRRDSQTIILDGAHNVAGFYALTESLNKHFQEKPHILIGVLADKDWPNICRIIAPYGLSFSCTAVSNHRTLAPEALATELKKHTPSHISVSIQQDVKDTLIALKDAPLILVCGSLYLISEALRLLDSNVFPHPLEGQLNDWGNTGQNNHLSNFSEQSERS
jgi:dihydrofolate synthase/folylpolyglutamate synthase